MHTLMQRPADTHSHPLFSLNPQYCSTSIPKQEKLLNLPGDRLFWSEADIVQATENFDQSHQISEGTFADIYWGQRNGVAFAFKKLREVRSGCLQGARGLRGLRLGMDGSSRVVHVPTGGWLKSRVHGQIPAGGDAALP